jgi:hypothetical protein
VERLTARRALIAVALGLLGSVAAAFGPPFCPLALTFDVPCPGCGLTRATVALLSGDLGAAIAFHPLSPILAPLFAGAIGLVLLDYVRGPGRQLVPPAWWTSRAMTVVASVLMVLMLGVWGARFAGAFGGPVPVDSLNDLRAEWQRGER